MAAAAPEREGVRAVGTVESFRDGARPSQRDVTVVYRLADGGVRRTSSHAGHHQRPQAGSPVDVDVDRDDPARAIVPELQSPHDRILSVGLGISAVGVPLGAVGA